MRDPTFRLEGVVHTKEELEDFEGPLTLILQLLSKNKIEIRDIKISLILEQYLEHLAGMDEADLEMASEFVAMASHLVYIKTKMLLTAEKEVTELEELITSLEQLKNRDTAARVKAVAPQLQELYRRGAGLMVKQPEPLAPETEYRYSHEKGDLLKALLSVFQKGDGEGLPPVQEKRIVPKRIVYPVGDKAEEILTMLRTHGVMRMNSLIGASRSRSEAVAAFVAILELCREGRILLAGSEEDPVITASETTDGEEEHGDS